MIVDASRLLCLVSRGRPCGVAGAGRILSVDGVSHTSSGAGRAVPSCDECEISVRC